MIAVVGGTGRLGRLVVTRLLDQSTDVRVVARNARRAEDLRARGADLVAADVRDAGSLRSALDGAEVVVSAVQGLTGGRGASPASIDRDGNAHLVEAAEQTGADVVMVSVVGACADSPMELFRMKWAAEQHLRASRVDWTIVRSAAFAELWLEVVRGRSARPQVLGRGANPMNFVSVGDVATAAARAATDSTLRGAVIEVGGPRDYTLTELAGVVSAAAPRHVPRFALRAASVLARPVSPQAARLAKAALVMDTEPGLAFDARSSHAAYSWLPCTPIA
jgi:NADH dehydrogenase